MDIIKAILDIEYKAQRIMDSLEEIKEKSEMETEREILRIETEMKENAAERVEEYRVKCEAESRQRAEEIKKLMDERKKALEETYKNFRSNRISDITAGILKDDNQ